MHAVIEADGEARAAEWLNAGAESVLLGEAALNDDSLVSRLAERFGEERIGLWLPVRRFPVEWKLDSQSNADFTVMAPSRPIPQWEVLDHHGEGTGTEAFWWASLMHERGATRFLFAVADPADEDLGVCAEGIDQLGQDRVWLAWGSDDPEELRFWVYYAGVRNLVLPEGTNTQALAGQLAAHVPAPNTEEEG